MADLPTSIHFRHRLAERYGLELTDDEYQDLCRELCEPGRYRPLRSGRGSRLVIVFRLSGQHVRAVWSPYTRQLITAIHNRPQED